MKGTEGFKIQVFLTPEHLLFPLIHDEWERHTNVLNSLFFSLLKLMKFDYISFIRYLICKPEQFFFFLKVIFAQVFIQC